MENLIKNSLNMNLSSSGSQKLKVASAFYWAIGFDSSSLLFPIHVDTFPPMIVESRLSTFFLLFMPIPVGKMLDKFNGEFQLKLKNSLDVKRFIKPCRHIQSQDQ